jgi:hypothetical protein
MLISPSPQILYHGITMTEQQWVTIDMLSHILRLPKPYIREMTKQGFLVTIGKNQNQRWLDPTPEYAEKLRLAAILHSRALFVPPDISEIALLTLREVAVLCGWTLEYARTYMDRYPNTPRFKVNSQLHLYSIKTVREILWRRQGRLHSKQKSPFLVQDIIDFVQREHARETADQPTDAEYAKDDKIMRKLEAIVRRSEKDQEKARQDFAGKVELARRIVAILESVKA